MSVKKVVFTWKSIEQDPVDYGNMNRLDIIFEEGKDKPKILIDAGGIKVEDNTFEIDNKEVLKKIGEIDFELKYDIQFPDAFCRDMWELVVDDKKYEGVLEDPHYVLKVKRIIRFNAIQVYANKKMGNYVKG